MSKLLKQARNMGKAIEVRLEAGSNEYAVILAGMIINHPRNCANGTCEGNFMFTDNLTYRVIPFDTLNEAETEFEMVKQQFVD